MESNQNNINEFIHPCCKDGKKGKCELVTISASQISALALFLLYLILDFCKIWNLNLSEGNWLLTAEVYFFAFITLVYYFLGILLVEEDLIDHLRELNRLSFVSQFIVRIVIVCTLGSYSTLKEILFGSEASLTISNKMIIVYCFLVFSLFIIWDFIVLLGNKKKDKITSDKILNFFVIDIFGFLLLLSFLVFNESNTRFNLVFLILLIALTIKMCITLYQNKAFTIFSRLFKISSIR